MSSIHIKHPGLLHEKLGVPKGQAIPESKLQGALHSSSPALRKEAVFAENFGHKEGQTHAQAVQSHIAHHETHGHGKD